MLHVTFKCEAYLMHLNRAVNMGRVRRVGPRPAYLARGPARPYPFGLSGRVSPALMPGPGWAEVLSPRAGPARPVL